MARLLERILAAVLAFLYIAATSGTPGSGDHNRPARGLRPGLGKAERTAGSAEHRTITARRHLPAFRDDPKTPTLMPVGCEMADLDEYPGLPADPPPAPLHSLLFSNLSDRAPPGPGC